MFKKEEFNDDFDHIAFADTTDNIKTIVIQFGNRKTLNRMLPHSDLHMGIFNGYFVLNKQCTLFGEHFEKINQKLGQETDKLHGLTFSNYGNLFAPVKNIALTEIEESGISSLLNDNYWIVGFDTAHFPQNPEDFSLEKVIELTQNFKKTLEQYSETLK